MHHWPLRGLVVLIACLALLGAGSGSILAAPGGNSDAASQCQQGGWTTLARGESPSVAFTNQGECVSYAARGGELVRHRLLGASACDQLTSWNGQTSLAGMDFSGCVVSDARLSGANLSGANLTDVVWLNTNLTEANLTGANLTGATLSGANLFKANLSGATLTGTYLDGAFLEAADLSQANLTCAKLWGADLTEATLTGADLSCANLQGATVDDAIFDGAIFSGYTTCPDGRLAADYPNCGLV